MADDREHVSRRRAPKACEFCRRRKIKCNNEEPRCANCRLYGKDCQYNALPKKSRPLQDRLADLEKENLRLHARLSGTASDGVARSPSVEHLQNDSTPQQERVSEEIGSPQASSTEPSRPQPVTKSVSPPSPHVTRIAAVPGGQPTYYGRTSALFDEEPSERRAPREGRQASEFIRRQLMGEAAHQRQLENINFKNGKLDFDGIDPELGMHLLSLHWNRQHHSHLITYRPAFMRDMACHGQYFSKLLLNAIYFGSCKFSPREELRGIQGQFRQRVRESLGTALDKSEITTIQAMLVMTNSLFALGDERSAAWVYAGIAFRMLIDLGAHVDDQNVKITEEDREIRCRVFWGAFVVDKIQSLYQGRPVSIQEADIRVPILFQDQYEELEHWVPFAYSETQRYPGSPAYSVSTFTELCKLSVIMNAILNNVYGVKSAKRSPDNLAEDLRRISTDLEKWQAALPDHLSFDSSAVDGTVPPPHVLSLNAMFNVLLILLHRPFVSEGHLHSMSPSGPADSFAVCALAATRIVQLLRIYEKTFSIRHAPYLIAYATYVSATIHVRIAAQLGPGSEAYTSLRTCLSVFVKNQETNSAARRAQTVIVNLMRKLKIELTPDEEQTPTAAEVINPTSSRQEHPARLIGSSSVDVTGEDGVAEPAYIGQSYNDPIFDLDMNAIIHSFIQGQQPPAASDPFPLEMARTDLHSQAPHDFRSDGYRPGWNMLDFPVDGSFDDTLFGFNGAAFDGVWQ